MNEEEQKFIENYKRVNGLDHANRVLEIIKKNKVEIPYGAGEEVDKIIDSINAINLSRLIEKSNEQLDVQKESLKEMVENSKKQKNQFIIATIISLIALIFSLGFKDWIISLIK